MRNLTITWLGHSTFLFRSPGGIRLLIDPWLKTNPSCPDSMRTIDALDLLLLTHGHADHSPDAVSVARAQGNAREATRTGVAYGRARPRAQARRGRRRNMTSG